MVTSGQVAWAGAPECLGFVLWGKGCQRLAFSREEFGWHLFDARRAETRLGTLEDWQRLVLEAWNWTKCSGNGAEGREPRDYNIVGNKPCFSSWDSWQTERDVEWLLGSLLQHHMGNRETAWWWINVWSWWCALFPLLKNLFLTIVFGSDYKQGTCRNAFLLIAGFC